MIKVCRICGCEDYNIILICNGLGETKKACVCNGCSVIFGNSEYFLIDREEYLEGL